MEILEKIKSFFRIMGVLFVSFGLIRDVFGEIALQPGFGTGGFGNGPVGQFFTSIQLAIFQMGVRTGMLTVEYSTTMFDKRLNAEFALLGFFMLVLAGLFSLIQKLCGR